MKKNALFLSIILLFSVWLVWHYVINFKLTKPSNPNYPDSFVQHIVITKTDDAGHREYVFSSPAAVHYSVNNRMDFASPHLIVYQTNQMPWVGDAQHGQSLNSGSQQTIVIWGNVVFKQEKGLHNPYARINTTALTFYPKQKYVVTDKFISGVQDKSNINGTGMTLNLKNHELKLLSQVNGLYITPDHKTVKAVSDRAELDKKSAEVTFLGHAKLVQNGNSYAAPKIEYDIHNRVVSAPVSKKGRTTIVIQPSALAKNGDKKDE